MAFYAAFNSISVISRQQLTLFVYFLGFARTRLGSEVTCPSTLPQKNPEDPVRLEPSSGELKCTCTEIPKYLDCLYSLFLFFSGHQIFCKLCRHRTFVASSLQSPSHIVRLPLYLKTNTLNHMIYD